MRGFKKIMRAFVTIFLKISKIFKKFTFPTARERASGENPHRRESESAH